MPIEYEAGWALVTVGPFLEKVKISCPCQDSSRRPAGLKHGVTSEKNEIFNHRRCENLFCYESGNIRLQCFTDKGKLERVRKLTFN